MFLIFEKLILLFGVSVNFFLFSKLIIRPVLWSTINTFLGCLLFINFLYLLVQIFLIGEGSENTDPNVDDFVQSLEYVFSDHYRSILCSAQYMTGFFHGSSTLIILLGIIFIRLMMIKYADNIRTDSLDRKVHQARLSIIGILVVVFIFTFCIGVIINLVLFPLSLFCTSTILQRSVYLISRR